MNEFPEIPVTETLGPDPRIRASTPNRGPEAVAPARSTRAQVLGQAAEERAAQFLEQQGALIVARNLRCRLGELDLVARHGEMLLFVEVRLRHFGYWGSALESIGPRKRLRLRHAILYYLGRCQPTPPCRCDAIVMSSLNGPLEWIQDLALWE